MYSTSILTSRRFLPLFLAQFLGALNDNFFKNAVVILVTYRMSEEYGIAPQTLVTLSGALFISPYIMFCATAGKLADKFDKARIARLIKYAEVLFMLLATIGFCFHLMAFLFLVLFLMGAHSAFFSPVKYALLPDQLHEDELMQGNAFIEGGTFIATLAGTIAGGLLVLMKGGEIIVSGAILSVAFLGVIASRFILPSHSCNSAVRIRANILRETWEILAYVVARKPLLKSVLANSWFWFVAMTLLTLFPAFTKQIIGADEWVVTLFFTSFSIGIGMGSVACGMLLKGKISTYWVPASAIFMSLFIFDLYAASPKGAHMHTGALLSITEFLATVNSYRMVGDLFMMALCGGFFVVPLYAIIQRQSAPSHRAQVMASNNVTNGFFMVVSALMALGLFALHYSVSQVFLAAGLLNVAVAGLLLTRKGRLVSVE